MKAIWILAAIVFAVVPVACATGPSVPLPTPTSLPTPSPTLVPTSIPKPTPTPTQREFWATFLELEKDANDSDDRWLMCPLDNLNRLGFGTLAARKRWIEESQQELWLLTGKIELTARNLGFAMPPGQYAGEDYMFPERAWVELGPIYHEIAKIMEESNLREGKLMDSVGCPK